MAKAKPLYPQLNKVKLSQIIYPLTAHNGHHWDLVEHPEEVSFLTSTAVQRDLGLSVVSEQVILPIGQQQPMDPDGNVTNQTVDLPPDTSDPKILKPQDAQADLVFFIGNGCDMIPVQKCHIGSVAPIDAWPEVGDVENLGGDQSVVSMMFTPEVVYRLKPGFATRETINGWIGGSSLPFVGGLVGEVLT